MSLKDIEKLREKVEKDPNSKLFVPLAEEYRKEGMLDEAIGVLLKGVENQPGYMSARVSLGKIYLEKGMPLEARAEFENVVHAIPDNLYAQKKLAEIYRDTGERELAIKSFRTVLKLNAMDEEALISLRGLEDNEDDQSELSVAVADQDRTETVLSEAESYFEEESEEAPSDFMPAEEQGAAAMDADDALEAFKDSLFGMTQASEEPVETEIEADIGDTFEVVSAEEQEAVAEVSFGEIDAAFSEEVLTMQFADEGPSEALPEELTMEAEEISAVEEEVPAGVPPFLAEAHTQHKGPTIEEADRRISEGNYAGAANIYRNILTLHPGDTRTLQRLEELKVLLRLLGKDKEVLIERLDAFLKGIEKRQHEFLGRP